MKLERLTAIAMLVLVACAPHTVSASPLKVLPAAECDATSVRICAIKGASCAVVRDRSYEPSEVCRWASRNTAAACENTAGIWTTASSKYARNHPNAVAPGSDGACITEVQNIRKSWERRTDYREPNKRPDHTSPGLETPSNLSVDDVSRTTLSLAWVDNSNSEFGVELYRIDPIAARLDQGADWELVGLFEERVDSNVKGTGLRVDEDYDLAPDTNYCYRVRAYAGFDRSDVSGFSGSVCTKTKP